MIHSTPARSVAGRLRRSAVVAVTAAATLVGVALAGAPAQAATNDIGHAGPTYSGVTHPPTSDKPQSKLWFNAGSWWATMWTTGKGWDIWKLNHATETWSDTGVAIDTRSTTLTDTLWDGTHLFVAAQVATVSTETSPVISKSGNPAKLYRYTYSGGTYKLDSGFPTSINNNSSESLTIDEDSTGAIWSTWTQVSSSTSNTVYVNKSSVGGTSWGTPFAVPTSNPHPSVDDISAVVAFKSKIGVLWSDQLTSKVFFALHPDSSTSSSGWTTLTARTGTNSADDHLNLKTIQADASGRVFAALKTSFDLNTPKDNTAPGEVLVTYLPSSNSFQTTTISTVGDCQTRPQVMLDSENSQIHVFLAGPPTTTTGCPGSGTPGAIYEKTSPMTNPTFVSGRGTPVIQDGSSAQVNNASTSKQSVTSATGLVVLASNDTTKRYWFSDETLGGGTVAPTASFTATPSTGAAPLTVAFADTSTGAPTSWAWTFGDGGTSTLQSPSHTYAAAGTYTATLTATNATGSNSTTKTITVTSAATAPTASFTATPSSGTAPLAVSFTDTSTGSPTSWAWDFGDGGTSTSQNPAHTYAAAGTYTATLTATNATGSNSTSQTITVTSAATAPTASFTATPSSGTAPLAVSFTDTSTGGPTSWAWDFGDGGTSTSQNPAHTYASAGTYTAKLTATNTTGSNSTSQTITVTSAGGGGGGSVTTGSSTTTVSTAKVSAVSVTVPSGVTTGDVLVAQFNTAGKPTVSSVPSGWSAVTGALSSGPNTLFAYYHVVSSAASEPSSYSFGLSAASVYNAGVTDYHGVNTTSPWDTSASTTVNTTAATTVVVPGITTATDGALVIGGVGLNSGGYAVTPPTGFTEEWESTGAQVAESAHKSMTTAGATGDATFKLGGSRAAAAWIRALRPA